RLGPRARRGLVQYDHARLFDRNERDDPRLFPRRHSGLLERLVPQLGAGPFVHLLVGRLPGPPPAPPPPPRGPRGARAPPHPDDPRLFARRHSRLPWSRDRLLDDRRLGPLGALDAGRSLLTATRRTRPVDSVEIEAGGAIGLDVAKLEAVDRG